MTLTELERAEVDRWLENLKAEARQLGGYLAGSPMPGEPGVRKNYEKSAKRFRDVTLRVSILERVAR